MQSNDGADTAAAKRGRRKRRESALEAVASTVVADCDEKDDDVVALPGHKAECTDHLRAQYRAALQESELSHDSLSALAMLSSSVTTVISVFSNLLYSNVNSSLANAEVRWLLVLLAVLVLWLFWAIELLVRSHLMFYVMLSSPTWFQLLLSLARNARQVFLFLLMTFATTFIAQAWLNSHFNVVETLCLVWVVFLGVQFALLVARK